MLKIQCPDCTQCFNWTDDMPFEGRCPNPDCEGSYNVHATLKKSIAARTPTALEVLACPSCGRPIISRWTVCGSCGKVVAGHRIFRRRSLFLAVVVMLIVLSLLVRYVLRF